MSRTFIAVLTLFLLASAAPAAANTIFGCPIVIDDFTQGALPPANGPFEFTHLGLPPQHCAGGSRHVVIDEVPTHLAGMVPLGGGDIGYQIQTFEKGSNDDVFDSDVLLDYEMVQPLDLLAGGANDRIVLEVLSVDQMSVFIYINSPGVAAGHTILLHPGENVLYLSTFAPHVDLTQVSRIRFFFNEYDTVGVSEVTLRQIRVVGSLKGLLLDIPDWLEIGPPFPMPGPLMDVSYLGPDGGVIQTTPVGIALESAVVLPGGELPFPVSMRSSDSGARRQAGRSAGFELVEAAAGKSSHLDGGFEFTLGLDSAGNHMPSRVVVPDAVEPVTAKCFLLPFEVEVMDAAGKPVGTHWMRLRVQVADAVPYRITGLRIHPPDPGMPSFGFGFEIHDDGTAGKHAEGQPLFDMSLEGDFVPYSASTATTPTFLPDGLRLSASPSVVSDRTVLSMSRALDREASVRIYDLAGRAVRTLRLAPGQDVLTWDTRDDAGRPVASGMYVARVDAGREVATRKLVVVH